MSGKVRQSAKRPKVPGSGGSRKGIPNKLTQSAKDAIAQVADGLGGAQGMLTWAQQDPINERLFWGTIYPKLLPLQLTGEGGGAVQTVTRIELAALLPKANG